MNKILLTLLVVIPIALFSQHPSCTNGRYADDIFDLTDIKVTKEIKYGQNLTWNGTDQELFLDLYEPATDLLENRPTIVLAFGGSFISGEREDMEELCQAYARKGYVAATIDYRLYDGPLFPVPDSTVMRDVVVRAIGDMKAAIRYLKENAIEYRLDPDYIISGGISAGAILAAHVAVLDEDDDIPTTLAEIIETHGGLEGNSSDNFSFDSDVIAFVNYSGALNNISLIDENDPPFISYHDDNDGVVPYGAGFATIFGIPIAPLFGSLEMHKQADSLGIPNELNTIENSDDHVSYFLEPTGFQIIIDNTASFLENIICAGISSTADNLNQDWIAHPNPSSNIFTFRSNQSQLKQINIYDMVGNLITVSYGRSMVDLSAQSAGMYLAEIIDGSKETKIIKLIKR